jgi:hypothetical protein
MKVVVLRSSRFHGAAIAACRHRWPGADLRVVCQPGSEHECRAAGVSNAAIWVYHEQPSFRPWAFARSKAGLAIRRLRPDVVVIQWDSRNGPVRGPLGLTALLARPSGVHVFRQDGTWATCGVADWVAATWGGTLWQTITRHAPGLLLVPAVAVATVCATPAWLVSRSRERRRMAASPGRRPPCG